nr:uncharacterized protein LOC113810745 [Penaeus vannamei]
MNFGGLYTDSQGIRVSDSLFLQEPLNPSPPLALAPEARRNSWTVVSPHIKASRVMDAHHQGPVDTKCVGSPDAADSVLLDTKPHGLANATPPALLEAKTESQMDFQSPGFMDAKLPSSPGVLAPYDPASLRLDLGTTTAWRSLKRDRHEEDAPGAVSFRENNDLFRNLDFMRNSDPHPRLDVGRGEVGPHEAMPGLDYAPCHGSSSASPAFRVPHVTPPDFGMPLATPQKKTRLAFAHDCFPPRFTSRLWPHAPFQARVGASHDLHCYRRMGVATTDLPLAAPSPLMPLPHQHQLLRPQPLTPLPPPALPSAWTGILSTCPTWLTPSCRAAVTPQPCPRLPLSRWVVSRPFCTRLYPSNALPAAPLE